MYFLLGGRDNNKLENLRNLLTTDKPDFLRIVETSLDKKTEAQEVEAFYLLQI